MGQNKKDTMKPSKIDAQAKLERIRARRDAVENIVEIINQETGYLKLQTGIMHPISLTWLGSCPTEHDHQVFVAATDDIDSCSGVLALKVPGTHIPESLLFLWHELYPLPAHCYI